jgi:hypothetical protein
MKTNTNFKEVQNYSSVNKQKTKIKSKKLLISELRMHKELKKRLWGSTDFLNKKMKHFS